VILYANGDSHTDGMDLKPHQKFINIVAEHYKINLINDAIPGASNKRIHRTTKEYLETNRPDLIIIGWSSWEREEWVHDNTYYNVNSSGVSKIPADLEIRYKEWVAEQNDITLNEKSKHWHDIIYNFHLTLTESKIPHVFFNCMYNFFDISENQKKDWHNCYIGPYDNDSSYYWYLHNQGYASDKWYHYGPEGHAGWACKLIDYIKEHNII